MRFAVAFVTMLIALVLVGTGFAQRTLLKPADHVSVAADVPGDTHYVVIPGSLLASHGSGQQLQLAGSGTVFAGYGRTADVTAWLSGQRYTELQVADGGTAVTSVARTAPVVNGLRGGAPDPDGSDLWMEQRTAQDRLDWKTNLPRSVSVIVASDGAGPAPSTVRITWPVDTATPLAVPLIVAGGLLAVVGLLLLAWALVHVRRSRGPRRKAPPKSPKRPQPPRYRPQRPSSAPPVAQRGRRSVSHRIALGGAGVVAVLVGAVLVPGGAAPAGAATKPVEASITEPQATRIAHRVAEVAAAADKARDAGAAAERFAGAALALRKASYAIRAKDKGADLPQAVPLKNATTRLILPEATATWPRTLFVVLEDPAKRTGTKKSAPLALAMVQADPRADYKVHFAMSLQPSAVLPDLPSALNGATRLNDATPVLEIAPGELGADYGALLRDSGSAAAKQFDVSHDELAEGVGEAAKKKVAKKLGSTAGITFKDLPSGPGSVVALSTAKAGALVAVQLDEQWTVKPKRTGVTVRPSGGTRILSKISATSKGIVSVYGYQLLFAVPSAGSNEPAVLLGYAQGLVSAKEL
ncbi:hypothetical protein [uncultured Amnibacterium sp.]|uniref:hypothetical protein n=1 Tax=uncultured Amnibacterium sp. TaxID=1631851 RepID=UPI0035CB025B